MNIHEHIVILSTGVNTLTGKIDPSNSIEKCLLSAIQALDLNKMWHRRINMFYDEKKSEVEYW